MLKINHNQFISFSTSIIIGSMTFQYRQFTKTQQKKLKGFDQLDIYFYKAKSTGVGIKARFTAEGQLPQVYELIQIQVKVIRNYDQLRSKKIIFEKWKKVKIPVKLVIHSLKKILKTSENEEDIEKLKKKHLKEVCTAIIYAIKNSTQLKKKHFKENPDLERWISCDDDLEEIYAVQKSRDKSSNCQEGFVSVIPLFKQADPSDQPIYRTTAYEQGSEQRLKKLLHKNLVNITENSENISYPSFLEKISTKQL